MPFEFITFKISNRKYSDMNIVLRDYQEEAVAAGIDHLNNAKEAALMVLPTGAGKSIVIANIVNNLPGRTIVFQPSKEILEQNFSKLLLYDPMIDAGIFSASAGRKDIRRIVYATIGTAINNTWLFEEYDNIIIDECHYVNPKKGMYYDFLQLVKTDKVLGLTATPYRLHSNSYGAELRFITRTRPKVFKKMIYYCQIAELQDRGYLAKTLYKSIDGFDTHRLKLNSTGADFNDQSLRRHMEEIDFNNSLQGVVQRLINAGRKNILVFTKFVEESENLVRNLSIPAAIVSANTGKSDRERILSMFKRGDIKVVSNVGVLTTGFDYPELDTVLIARPTMSLALWYQMVGRGIRPHESKDACWVVDMCQNFQRFGRVENLEITCDKPNLWYIKNRVTGRPLTNTLLTA